MESSPKQGTVGKDVLGIMVTDAEGNRISFRRATVRQLGKIASALPALAGFAMIGFTAKKQGLHDLMTEPLIVRRKPDLVPDDSGTRRP